MDSSTPAPSSKRNPFLILFKNADYFRIQYTGCLGYYILAALFISFHFCGKDAVSDRLNKLEEKIIKGDDKDAKSPAKKSDIK
jgi:hypothetical protein